MKTLVIILMATIIFREIHCSGGKAKPIKKPGERLGDRVNWYTVKEKLIDSCAHIKSTAGNAYINMRRVLGYAGLRFQSWLLDRDFILGKVDAAYFFQDEQEVRDQAIAWMQEELDQQRQKRDAARPRMPSIWPWKWGLSITNIFKRLWKGIQWIMLNRRIGKMKGEVASAQEFYNTEFFCEDPTALVDNCRLALRNAELQGRISLTLMASAAQPPACDMKPLQLETGFKSVRRFLICPVVAYKVHSHHQTPIDTYVYITSIENPSKYRMRYYMFMSPDVDLAVELPEPVNPAYPPYPPPPYYAAGYYAPPHDPKYPPPYEWQYPTYPGYPPAQNASQPASQYPPYSSLPAADSSAPSEGKKNRGASQSPPPPEARYSPPQIFAPYPTIDSPPHATPSAPPDKLYYPPPNYSPPRDAEKPPRASNSPPPPNEQRASSPPPMFEGAKSGSTNHKNNEQSPKKTWWWSPNGSKAEEKTEDTPGKKPSKKESSKKEPDEKPLRIVTLVINRDFRAYDKYERKQKQL